MSKKNKLLLFLVIFSISIIASYPAFIVSHSLDSYCTMCNGYNETALLFLQNGRPLTALSFYFFDLINFPFDSVSYISALFLNLFLSLTILKLYLILNDHFKNNVMKVIGLIAIFLLFYNPFLIEVLVLDEAFIFGLGILLLLLGSNRICNGGVKNYLLGSLYTILGILCYQGIACYFFLFMLLILFSKNDSIKNILKKLGVGALGYLLGFVVSLVIIKLTGSATSKVGDIDLVYNINHIITSLMPDSLNNLFGFINYKYYYICVFALLVCGIITIVKNDNKRSNSLWLILLLICALLMPFVPNIFMSSSSNYTAARMCMTLMCFPSILTLFIVFKSENNILNYITLGFVTLFCLLSGYLIHQNLMIDYKRYIKDVKYINTVTTRISWHENETDDKITKIYYARDTDSAYYYSTGYNNGANIRLEAVDWAFECAFAVYAEGYEISPMSEEDYEKYFKDKNYDEDDAEEYVWDDDTLYLLIY